MLFEGTEKKFEIAIEPGGPDLRALGDSFWREVVAVSGAEMLAGRRDAHLDAWLLSESSLFVTSRWALMITCGRTTLIDGLLHVLDRLDLAALGSLIYERKNENFPDEQRTSFADDVRRLRERLPGTEHVFGQSDGDHISLFHLDRPATIPAGDTTLELLMHGIDPQLMALFTPAGPGGPAIRDALGLSRLLPGFAWDDHLFHPMGYSLNAVSGRRYATMHVTPEREGSYASFEMGWDFTPADAERCIARLMAAFRPHRADLLYFSAPARLDFLPAGYAPRRVTDAVLGNGYHVVYCHLEGEPWISG